MAQFEWKDVRASSARGGLAHLRWDFRKRAKALAPMCREFVTAFWTPGDWF